MTTTKFLRLVAPIAFLAAPLAADSLTGKVMDPQGAAVPQADVSLFDRNSGNLRKTTSSESGDFNFADIPAGRYLLSAQSNGSAMTASEEVEVSGSATKELKLDVAAATVRVLVSATSTPVFEQEVTRSIDVVDAKEINQRVEYLVAEALRTVPGVQIQTQVGGVVQVRSRGMGNQYTGVLIDGLRFRDTTAITGDASGFMSDLNVTDLSSMEFMRGSGSSLYGTNAIAGSLSLNSNDGGGKMHGAFRVEGGGLGFYRSTLNVAGGVKDNKFVYSGGASHVNVTSGVRGNTPNRNNSGQLFGKYNFTPKLSLSGRVWGADVWQRSVTSPAFPSSLTANFPPGTAPVEAIPLADDQLKLYDQKLPFSPGNATFIPGVANPDGNRKSSFAAAAFILRHQLSANTSWRASYQLVDTRRAFYDGPRGTGSFEPTTNVVSNFNGRTDQLQLRFDTELGGFNRITAGYEFENEDSVNGAQRNQIGGARVDLAGQQRSHSLYGQDQIHLFDNRLQIVLGGRIQKFDLKQPAFTGNPGPYAGVKVESPEAAITGDISVAYFFTSTNTKLRGHLGNGYRAPSLYERFGSGYFSGFFSFYGDPRLKSEKSKSYEAGIDQYLFRNKVRASATWFYTDLSELIAFANSFTGDPFGRTFGGYYNAFGGGISRGAELSAQFTPTRKTSVTTSYTYVNADQRSPSYAPANFYKVFNVAPHIFSITATQWITNRLNATVDYYFLGSQYQAPFGANRLMQFGGPKKADLVVNYNLPLNDVRSMDFYFKIENFGNVRYTDGGFLAPQAWGIGGIKFNF